MIVDGYCLIDLLMNYDNEGIVGKVICWFGVFCFEFYIILKLLGKYYGYDDVLISI